MRLHVYSVCTILLLFGLIAFGLYYPDIGKYMLGIPLGILVITISTMGIYIAIYSSWKDALQKIEREKKKRKSLNTKEKKKR